MNNALFTSLITSLTALDDTQGAQLLAIVNGFTSVGTPTHTPAPAPAPERKNTADPASDAVCKVSVVKANKRVYACTLGMGDKCARNAHDAAKDTLKSAGFVWVDPTSDKWDKAYADGRRKGVWVGTPKMAETLGLTADGGAITVTKAQVQAIADRKQARAERKARKAQKGA